MSSEKQQGSASQAAGMWAIEISFLRGVNGRSVPARVEGAVYNARAPVRTESR